LPGASLTYLATRRCDFAETVTSVGKPLTLIDVATRPLEHAESGHVSLLPLSVVDDGACSWFLGLSMRVNNLTFKEALAVVFSLVPLASVPAQTLVKDQVAKVTGLALGKLAKVDLLDHSVFLVRINDYKSTPARLPRHLWSHVHGAIWQGLHLVRVPPHEFKYASKCLLVSLISNDLEVKLAECFAFLVSPFRV